LQFFQIKLEINYLIIINFFVKKFTLIAHLVWAFKVKKNRKLG
jgi:hypothetical protein